MTNPIRTVLISGASVAGPSLAFWLSRFGFEPTIVERSPTLRPGGHAVDFRGTSVEALRRMNLLEAVEAAQTHMGDMHFVDVKDRVRSSLPSAAMSGEVEIMRGDLAAILYDATRAGTEYIFGDSIAELAEFGDGVEVRFESGEHRTFDLVIGADGLHSRVRALTFGPEQQFIRHLGLYVSVFSLPNFPGLDHTGRLYCAPGSLAGIYSARGNSEARAMLWFHADRLDYDYRDIAAQQEIIGQRFAGQGWHVPRILEEMGRAPDFYFDAIAQVHLPEWSKGRVGLLGDAAGCASPLSGMGTGMAVVGASMLAEELRDAAGDFVGAFARYQTRMTPFVAASQKLAHGAGSSFVPKSTFGIAMRNLLMKLLPLMPGDAMLKPVLAAANAVSL